MKFNVLLIMCILFNLLPAGTMAQDDDLWDDDSSYVNELEPSTVGPDEIPTYHHPCVSRSGKKKKWTRVGCAYEDLYQITDKSELVKAFTICKYIQKQAKKAELWCMIPAFVSSLNHNIELIEADVFLNSLIESNLRLKEALNTSDPEQRLTNLKQAYYNDIYHQPTQWALIDALWEHGNEAGGDLLLSRVLSMEPKEFHWQSQVLNSRKEFNHHQIDSAISLITKITLYHTSATDEVNRYLKNWTDLIDSNNTNPKVLFEIGALNALESLAKTNVKAILYLSRAQGYPNNINTLKKARKKYPDNVAIFLEYVKQVHSTSLSRKKRAKIASALLTTHPKNPMLQIYALNPKTENEDTFNFILKTFNEHPENDDVFQALCTIEGDHFEEVNTAILKHLELNPSGENYLLHFDYLASKGKPLDGLPSLLRAFETHPYPITILKRFKNKVLPQLDQSAETLEFRKWLAYCAISRGLENIDAFTYFLGLHEMEYAMAFIPEKAKAINLILGNFYYSLDYQKQALPYFEKAVQDFPEKSCLQELYGDTLLAKDLLGKSIKAYETSLSLEPGRPGLSGKLEFAKKQYGKKVGKGVLTVIAVVATMGTMAGSGMVHVGVPYYHRNTQRINIARNMASRKGLNLFSTSDTLVSSSVGQTEELLLDFYNYYLDLEAKFADGKKPAFIHNL